MARRKKGYPAWLDEMGDKEPSEEKVFKFLMDAGEAPEFFPDADMRERYVKYVEAHKKQE